MPLVPNPDIFGPATLSVTQGFSAFMGFLPKFSEVRKSNPVDNPDLAADVRMGEIAATTVTLGMGLIASSLTGSPVPTLVSVAVSLMLVALYESTLRADNPGQPKTGLHIVPNMESA